MAQQAWWREPTRAQWLTFAAAWSGWVLDAFDFTVFLLVMPSLAAHFHVPLTATASTITLTLLMRLVGGVGAGWLADRFGRKLPLILSVA
jgi:MFS transporter, SHS family, lactate transporter